VSETLSVSVVVPVLNGAASIGSLLDALGQQAVPPPDCEIIVVDNGSTDGTPDIVRRFGVTLLEEGVRGPAAARNRGLRHATGEVVAHLDADTQPSRRWLAELVAPFAAPQVVLTAGRTVCYPQDTAAGRYVAASGLYETERAINREPFPFAPSLNMAIRRAAAEAVGGWATDMMTGEDVDFSHRVLRAFPSRIVYRPGAVLFHRTRATAEELRRQAWTYGEGAAHLYLRYPEVVRWDLPKTLVLGGRLILRSAMPTILAAGHAIGRASAKDVEFARYHRLWTWWFWRGFFSMYRHRERRPP
jgi:glycosyltransferase involved in cell wall biosynthesis